jgi:hypothetical protein
MSGDAARVSVTVAVPPPLAFEIFTAEIDRWWRRGTACKAQSSAA